MYCGINDCPWNNVSNPNQENPPSTTVKSICFLFNFIYYLVPFPVCGLTYDIGIHGRLVVNMKTFSYHLKRMARFSFVSSQDLIHQLIFVDILMSENICQFLLIFILSCFLFESTWCILYNTKNKKNPQCYPHSEA